MEGDQQLRLRRQFLAAGCYGLLAAVLAGAWLSGRLSVSSTGFGVLLACCVIAAAAPLLLVVSGANRRFGDPSMTWPQAAAALLLLIVCAWLMENGRLGMFGAAAVVVGFAALRLDGIRLLLLAGSALVLAAGLELLRINPAAATEWFDIAVLGALLTSSAALGREAGGLRLALAGRMTDLGREIERQRAESTRDVLTGMPNQRRLSEELHIQKGMADRTGHVFTLLLVDVRELDRVGEIFGLQQANDALVAVAGIVRASLRDVDLAARLPGTAFGLLLVGTPAANAHFVIERLEAALADLVVNPLIPELRLECRTGIAQYEQNESLEALEARAAADLAAP